MFNLAAAIIMACGVADNNETLTCWDVYNNCVLSKVAEADQKTFNACKASYDKEYKRIRKLQEEK